VVSASGWASDRAFEKEYAGAGCSGGLSIRPQKEAAHAANAGLWNLQGILALCARAMTIAGCESVERSKTVGWNVTPI
jgi:hypothetical protein